MSGYWRINIQCSEYVPGLLQRHLYTFLFRNSLDDIKEGIRAVDLLYREANDDDGHLERGTTLLVIHCTSGVRCII